MNEGGSGVWVGPLIYEAGSGCHPQKDQDKTTEQNAIVRESLKFWVDTYIPFIMKFHLDHEMFFIANDRRIKAKRPFFCRE